MLQLFETDLFMLWQYKKVNHELKKHLDRYKKIKYVLNINILNF